MRAMALQASDTSSISAFRLAAGLREAAALLDQVARQRPAV
jgi:hypothetical protein